MEGDLLLHKWIGRVRFGYGRRYYPCSSALLSHPQSIAAQIPENLYSEPKFRDNFGDFGVRELEFWWEFVSCCFALCFVFSVLLCCSIVGV